MKPGRFAYLVIAVLTISSSGPVSRDEPNLFAMEKTAPEAVMRKLADGFKFTEGPAADAQGNIYFTDIPNDRIHKWSLDGRLSTFRKKSQKANGLYFDRQGNLLACAGGTGKILSIDPQSKITVLADNYQGKPFNSPNDLWPDPNDGIYFTDPRYGSRENLPQDGEHVYYLSPDRKTIIRVINDMVRPNGLIGTPDGKRLYVTDHGSAKTYVYKIKPDATLTDKKLFAQQGSDGMTLDAAGNLYLTADAVNVYAPSGKLLKTITVPERPANVTFGGKNKNTLFITAQKSLYALDMKSKFYNFTMQDITGQPLSLSQYQNKVLLVVNVASQCGYTKQYAGLQQLYEKYKDRGLVVLGFPANDFGSQEPGANPEIKRFCTANFKVTFPLFAKISVHGEQIHPLYQYLTSPDQNPGFGTPITWNFNKILIGPNGETLARFESKTEPLSPQITNAVETALNTR